MNTKASSIGKIMTTVMGCWLKLKYLMDKVIIQVEISTELIKKRVFFLMRSEVFILYHLGVSCWTC